MKVRITPEYVGDGNFPDEGTIELTYKLTGAEDGPMIGTIELELPDGSHYREEQRLTTPSSGAKITAKVTEVDYNE